jgi:hypothetical protein
MGFPKNLPEGPSWLGPSFGDPPATWERPRYPCAKHNKTLRPESLPDCPICRHDLELLELLRGNAFTDRDYRTFVQPKFEQLGVRIKVLCVVCCVLALASSIEGVILWRLL